MLNPKAKPFVYDKSSVSFPIYHPSPNIPYNLGGFCSFYDLYYYSSTTYPFALPPPYPPYPPLLLSPSFASSSHKCTTTNTATVVKGVLEETKLIDKNEPKEELNLNLNLNLKRESFVGGHDWRKRRRRRRNIGLMWREKMINGFNKERVDSSPIFNFNEHEAYLHAKTTVMIKNIPSKLSRKKLIDLVDSHCGEENDKTHHHNHHQNHSSSSSSSILSEYDFVYLPMDFRSGLNLGYAFVNFTSVIGAVRFYRSYEKYKWDVFGSNKICQIKHALLQGKNALVEHFRNSNFKCDSDEYLPVLFSPPRNGSSSCPSPSIIAGRRCGRAS